MVDTSGLCSVVDRFFGDRVWESVRMPPVQQQLQLLNLCGVFCLAWIIEIVVNRTAPEFVVFEQSEMRSHLEVIMQNEHLSVFPHGAASPPSTSSSDDDIKELDDDVRHASLVEH
jgi:hypothetical protein